MASTYALPIAPTSHTHSHGRSSSQYTPESSAYTNNSMDGASPAKDHGHRHTRSDMNANGQLHGAVRSPLAEYNSPVHEHEHGHVHERSGSNGSTYTLKPFWKGRPKGLQRGESDLGRSPARIAPAAGGYGFSPVSPIQESPAHAPPPPVSS
jgi:zinc transporter 5/7